MRKACTKIAVRRFVLMLKSKFGYTYSLTFLIALVFRLVPEIVAGVWPLGFDTVTYYTPTVMQWAGRDSTLNWPNSYAPLLYFLLFSVYSLVRNVFLAIKIVGPLLYGALALSFNFFLVKGLNWNPKKGLFASLFFIFFFVTLRISWDLYRNMLGLVFLLLILPLLRDFGKQPKRRKAIVLALSIFVTLSHELATVIMLASVFVIFIQEALVHKQLKVQSLRLFSWFVPSLLLFALLMYTSVTIFHEVPGSINYFVDVQRGITYDSYFVLVNDVLGLFLLSYGLILPLVILGFFRDKALDSWFVICLFCSFWPLFNPWFEVAPWNRWMYMLDVPIIVYAANGLERLGKIKDSAKVVAPRKSSWLSSVLILSVVIAVGFSYVVLPLSTFPPQNPTIERLSLYIPGGLLSNTFPISDNGDLEKSLQWVNNHLDNESVLIYHESLTGWVDLYIAREKHVVNYHFGSPLDGLEEALSKGYDKLYVIWWVNGNGWYGQKSMPEEFGQPVFVSSRIGVFFYVESQNIAAMTDGVKVKSSCGLNRFDS